MATASGNGATAGWVARWCWTGARLVRPWNSYAYFRRAIDLPDRPTSAVVRISADARYTLFVNGRRVHQGPARSFPEHQSYDTLDLADFLTAGPNVVGAVVHQFGVPTSQSVYRDATGFILDGVVESNAGAFELHTPGEWLARDAAGWRKHVARLSAHLGFQEHFDADADPPDWLKAEFEGATEEDGWRPPVEVAPAAGHPWLAMEPRGVPLLTEQVESFAAAVSHFSGENARGYKVAEDVYQLARSETRKKVKTVVENPDAMLRDDDQSSVVPELPDGQFHAAVLDLGRVRTGHITLDVSEAAGDEIVDVLYVQEVDRNGAPVLPDAAQTGDAPADRYRCRPGAQRWESFWPKGFRYALLVFRNVEKPLRVRHVGVRAVRAALEPAGRFECGDERLNAVYAAGVETLRACTLDAIVDCPAATQSQRWDYARPHARAAAVVFDDGSMLERGVVQVAQSQAADGSLHAYPPSDDPRGRRADAMCAWVATLWDLYFHTGRADVLHACRPQLDRALEFLGRHERFEGLIGGLGAFAPTTDAASDLHLADFSAPVNLLYLEALRCAADVYELLGLEKDSAFIAKKADTLAKAVDAHFWDAKAKAWRDALDPEAKTPGAEASSLHTAALAILLGLRPEAHAAQAKEIARVLGGRRGRTVVPSPPLAGWVLDALVQADLRAEALEVIAARWGGMLDKGATTFWERWDGATGSRCCAASASPVRVLSEVVLGVKAVEPGWRRLRIRPFVGSLEFARGAVPTPRGIVRVEWEKAGEDQLVVRVELPDGVEADFHGPLGETRELEGGASEFHT
jgi:hypothetical protein